MLLVVRLRLVRLKESRIHARSEEITGLKKFV
jgi:hypothetical protein